MAVKVGEDNSHQPTMSNKNQHSSSNSSSSSRSRSSNKNSTHQEDMGRFFVLYFNIKTDALDYHRGSLRSFPGKNAATFLNPVHNWQVYIWIKVFNAMLTLVMYLALSVEVSLKSVTIKKRKIPYVISEYLMNYWYKVKLFLHMPWRLVGELEVEFLSFLILALDRGASFISCLIISEYYTTWILKILWK
jgi:hypothetical protein